MVTKHSELYSITTVRSKQEGNVLTKPIISRKRKDILKIINFYTVKDGFSSDESETNSSTT